MDAIEKSKENEAAQLLTGFGIPNVGKAAAKAIMMEFQDMDRLSQADAEALQQVNDIGEVSAKCILEFFAKEENRQMLERLKGYGVNMQAREQALGGRLEGMTFVVTGTLPTLGRKEAAEMIERQGGKVSGSVSRKTTMLLAGENAGSKLIKAQELGVQVIGEEELRAMLEA